MRHALVGAIIAFVASDAVSCVDWLDAPDDEPQYVLPVGEPLVLPNAPPLVEAPGPLVPRTPGLRVPLAGYWTRVRLDAQDLLLPYSWASLSIAKAPAGSSGGATRDAIVLLRMEGATSQGEDSAEGPQSGVGFRAVIPIVLPAGTDGSVIRDGFVLPDNALSDATMALRTSPQDLWLITPTRLRFDTVSPVIITGSLEGEARRGAKGQRTRRFAAAFIALRAPDGDSDAALDNTFVPPDSGGPATP